MKITDLTNLFVANYNDGSTNFNVLVVALDEVEAHEIAVVYFQESRITDSVITLFENLTIHPFEKVDTKFDCDYAITYCDAEVE